MILFPTTKADVLFYKQAFLTKMCTSVLKSFCHNNTNIYEIFFFVKSIYAKIKKITKF